MIAAVLATPQRTAADQVVEVEAPALPRRQGEVPRQEYHARLVEQGLPAVIRDPWSAVYPAPQLDYGWKLHLSAVQVQVDELLERVTPLLKQRQTPFKIARNAEVLARLNEGAYGATQVGKFMTIYPRTDRECTELAEELVVATSILGGPRIVTDCYLGGAVYARYGIINPLLERDRLGTVNRLGTNPEAAYKVPFHPPAGIYNPVGHLVQPTGAEGGRLAGRTLEPATPLYPP